MNVCEAAGTGDWKLDNVDALTATEEVDPRETEAEEGTNEAVTVAVGVGSEKDDNAADELGTENDAPEEMDTTLAVDSGMEDGSERTEALLAAENESPEELAAENDSSDELPAENESKDELAAENERAEELAAESERADELGTTGGAAASTTAADRESSAPTTASFIVRVAITALSKS